MKDPSRFENSLKIVSQKFMLRAALCNSFRKPTAYNLCNQRKWNSFHTAPALVQQGIGHLQNRITCRFFSSTRPASISEKVLFIIFKMKSLLADVMHEIGYHELVALPGKGDRTSLSALDANRFQ
jgi:hypothetical protein